MPLNPKQAKKGTKKHKDVEIEDDIKDALREYSSLLENKSNPLKIESEDTLDVDGFPTITTKGENIVSFNNHGEDGGDDDEKEGTVQITKKKKIKGGGFQSMGLSYPVYKAILMKGYKLPTPIQRKTIPLIMSGADVVAMARTGSGKTAAFLIPMLEKLKSHSKKIGVRALILAPTRELAVQTLVFTTQLSKLTDLRISLIVGGDSMSDQFDQLFNNPDIIIATPGRLMHHLKEVDGFNLLSVEYVVFDECDRLFELGFADQLREILGKLSPSRQTLLFSATLPSLLVDFARAGLNSPQLVRLDTEIKISEDLRVSYFTLRPGDKIGALLYLLKDVIPPRTMTIVFAATKHHVEFIHAILNKSGVPCTQIYGDMDPSARKINIGKFKTFQVPILIVTDLAARGIDIPLLDNVINFDFPPRPKLFVHRVGRVARAGRLGVSYSFVTPDEIPFMIELHLFLGRPLQNILPEGASYNPLVHDGYYGSIDESLLTSQIESVKEMIFHSHELKGFERGMNNAQKLYFKTRPTAAPESVRRAKELPVPQLHVMFWDKIREGTIERSKFVENLKTFRPHLTVLEMNDASGTPAQIMKTKRKKDGNYIGKIKIAKTEPVEQKIEPEMNEEDQELMKVFKKEKEIQSLGGKSKNEKKKKQQNFKDEEFFMSNEPSKAVYSEKGYGGGDNELNGKGLNTSVAMDLIGDDAEKIMKQKSVFKWDKKRQRYVHTTLGVALEKKTPKVRNEAGKIVEDSKKKGKGSFYQEWQKKTKKTIRVMGEEEKGQQVEKRERVLASITREQRYRKGEKSAKTKDEVKSVEDYRKFKKVKEHNKLKNRKGGFKGEGNNKSKPNHRVRGVSTGGKSKFIKKKQRAKTQGKGKKR